MNTQKLMDILSQLQNKIESHKLIAASKKQRYLQRLEKSKQSFNSLEIDDSFTDLYNSLINRGTELLNDLKKNRNLKEIDQKANYYFRYIQASNYDFRSDLKGLNYYTRTFMVTAALFMGLTPQFYGFVLPIIFILPIFSGLKGIKRRNRTGFLLTLAVVPMAIMTSITWIRYFFQVALPDFDQTIAETSNIWKVSPGIAQLLIVVPSILSILLIVISLATAYLGYKYRDMFV